MSKSSTSLFEGVRSETGAVLATYTFTRRYKYLQKPLEESALPGLLQYVHRWAPVQQEKIAITTGLLIQQGLVTAGVLQSLTKDHLIKDGGFALLQSRVKR
jgi:hypothetical protein